MPSELIVGALLTASSAAVWIAIVSRLVERRQLVPYEPRQRVPWTVSDTIVLFVLWIMFDSMALAITVPRKELLGGQLSSTWLAALTTAHALWIVVALVYLETRTRKPAQRFGFDTSQLGRDTVLGILGFLAAAPVVYGVQFVVSQYWKPHEHPLAKLMLQERQWPLLALAVLGAVVVAPLAEELSFRVVFQGWLERVMRPRLRRFGRGFRGFLPIVISAALFALAHQGADRIALFVLALFLGYLYHQTHRIYPSLVLHACVNATAVLALWSNAN